MEDQEPIPYSVTVDREMCQTAAVCLAYNMYELDDEGKAVLLTKGGQSEEARALMLDRMEQTVTIDDLVNPDNKSPEEMRRLVLESAKICPFNAIIVKDSEGNIIWPI
jgi:ferredoxin